MTGSGKTISPKKCLQSVSSSRNVTHNTSAMLTNTSKKLYSHSPSWSMRDENGHSRELLVKILTLKRKHALLGRSHNEAIMRHLWKWKSFMWGRPFLKSYQSAWDFLTFQFSIQPYCVSCSFCPICSFFPPPSQIKSLQSLESSLLRGYHQALGSGERESGKRGRKNERHRKKRRENCPLTVQESQCRTIRGHNHDTKLRLGAEHLCWEEKKSITFN